MPAWLARLLAQACDLGHGLVDLFYPNLCFVCAKPLHGDPTRICFPCQDALFVDPHLSCPRCAATVGPYVIRDGRCPACRDESLPFESAHRFGVYDGLMREVILRMKRDEMLAEVVGQCWAKHAQSRLGDLNVDAVVPVPLFWWRRWTRGYNQSGSLAEAVARQLGVGYRPDWVRRIRNTAPQTLQPTSASRRLNIRGAFRSTPTAEMQGKRVLVVDDVMTTGATVAEVALALKKAGVGSVVVAALARPVA